MKTVTQIEGANAEQAQLAIREIARFQGQFWEAADDPSLAACGPFITTGGSRLMQAIYLLTLPPDLRTFRRPVHARNAPAGGSLRNQNRRPFRRRLRRPEDHRARRLPGGKHDVRRRKPGRVDRNRLAGLRHRLRYARRRVLYGQQRHYRPAAALVDEYHDVVRSMGPGTTPAKTAGAATGRICSVP